ncbi:MAG: methylated-DNA--[protein]-cysteine S-methyltransferase [Solirubrobacteraceae bacterium]|nr:methylated-DNA--[protein]-cysteine S-methyltransferase [Solirubrobacteraceae bacterium]
MLYDVVDSPIGALLLSGDGEALCGLWMQDGSRPRTPAPSWRREPAAFAEAAAQLEQYFARERTTFELPLAMEGTEFQRRVWAALREIPYGQTRSYGELAAQLGQPAAARAVGLANGSNPISVIVPCHRVIGADGSLTGFGGGLPRKRALLELESLTLL